MTTKKKSSLFTIRRIANRNPRLPRLYRAARQKIWRLAVVVFLAVAGVASLFFFESNFTSANFNSQLLAADASVLGSGFENITGFSGEATNPSLTNQGGEFADAGTGGTINAVLYNVKDYFKYIAGSGAVLFMIIAATQIVLAQSEESIKKGKQNLIWSIVALVLIFAVDSVIVTFFEGGGYGPQQSLVTVDEAGNATATASLFSNISLYFKANARIIFSYLKTLIGSAAILFIVFAGVQMVTAGGSEEKIEKEKKYLMHILTAFVTVLLLDTMIFTFIYPDSTSGAADPICVEFMNYVQNDTLNNNSSLGGMVNDIASLGDLKNSFSSIGGIMDGLRKIENVAETVSTMGGSTGLARNYGITVVELTARISACRTAARLGLVGTNQIIGIVRFFETFVGAIAVFFMVYSGTAIIASMGNEEIIKKHKTTLLWSIAGLIIVMLSNLVVTQFFFIVDPETGQSSVAALNGVNMLSGVTNFIASFVGIFSVISIVVAGTMWVANFGNDDLVGKAKKIIFNAIIGVILSVSAYAIVHTITGADSQGGTGTSIGISI
ncbi:MAG: pilin [Patescibacteria group bacterium]